ncbi:amino acid transporter [Corynebacterium phocae]|uniref:Amino acid transporter n=1 Tax=Corynebacterium phocae TaxID=161895 RepID=A0A1L7D4P4_9CORY|nr:methionine/alanine import NSS transporter subunit MetS [Corynebacterium phocae]APT93109.1 amino acid transporter [Corynebacterium phocae]KAA8722183.1 methionine/alanine import NSS transporter subunit MetS [Corynebacterium phocae]
MEPSSLILMVLFILIIWGGLVGSSVMLARSTDETTGELGTAPGTDDESLMHRAA